MRDNEGSTPPQFTVTIPSYNEANNIAPLWDKVRTAMDALEQSWELIRVNDGSAEQLDAKMSTEVRR